MTINVDPALVAAINDLRPDCCHLDGDGTTPCTDPAAWLVTWTARRGTFRAIAPTCIGHYADTVDHRAHCANCRMMFDLEAVEL